MPTPGYRASDSVKLFIATSIEELVGPGSQYTDFFDLKNTFQSFTFQPPSTMPGGERIGMYKLVLINPGLALENKLFSLYSALFPRSKDKEQTLKYKIDASTFYIRWGYVTGYTNANPEALSHIHAVKLLQVDYELSEGNERIVTLRFSQIYDSIYKSLNTNFTKDAQITIPATYSKGTDTKIHRFFKFSTIIRQVLCFPQGYAQGYEVVLKDNNKLDKLDSALDRWLLSQKVIGFSGLPSQLKDETTHDRVKFKNNQSDIPFIAGMNEYFSKFNLSLLTYDQLDQKTQALFPKATGKKTFAYFGVKHPILVEFSILLNSINDVLSKEAKVSEPDLLRLTKIEYSMVPENKKDELAKLLGKNDAGDLSGIGAILITNLKYCRDFFTWADEIRSFPIVPDLSGSPNTILLSHGTPNLLNNIITNLSINFNNNLFFTTLSETSVALQTIYSIQERFKDPNNRLKILRVLSNYWYENNFSNVESEDSPFVIETSIGLSNPESNAAWTDLRKFEDKQLQGKSFFADETLRTIRDHARGYSIASRGEATSSTAEDLDDEFIQDLFFIMEDPLLFDIFFPTTSNLKYTRTTWSGINNTYRVSQEVHSPNIYRTISHSPLHTFTEALSSRGVSGTIDIKTKEDEEKAVVLLAKLRQLRRLRAGLVDINLETLGVPEMDTIDNEMFRREVVLQVAEPRDPGNLHWATGVYFIKYFSHVIDNNGYRMNLSLLPKITQTFDETLSYISKNGNLLVPLGEQ